MMQCPRCKENVSEILHECPHCGYDLIAYQSFNTIKDELGSISAETLSLSKKLDQMQKRLAQLDSLFSRQVLEGEEMPAGVAERIEKSDASISEGETETLTRQQVRKQPLPVAQPRRKKTQPTRSRESEIKFGQQWLLIAGVVLTILAVGWFLKYSFDQNWIGPAGRVAMAYFGGMAFLGVGEYFRSKNFHVFGLYLIGGGIAMLYFATFAAFHIYHLISQVPAFGIMILVTTLACTLSLVYDTKWLAVLGLIGGFMTPVILSTGVDKQVALMTYITILNVGILTIAFFRQWPLLNYLGFLFTWILFSGWYAQFYADEKFWKTIIFLNIFFLIYAIVPFIYHVVREHEKRLRGIWITMPNAFIAFGFSFAIIKASFRVEMVSIVSVTYAAIFLWMAHTIYRRDRKQVGAFVMMIGKAILFLVLTVPILFSDHWITFFWAIQAVVLVWAAVKLDNRLLYGSFFILVLITLGKFFFYDYHEVFHLKVWGMYFKGDYTRLLLERFLTSAMVLVALFQSARLVAKSKKGFGLFAVQDTVFWWAVFAITLFLILNVEVAAFFHDYARLARFAAISVLWALFAIVLMIFGFWKNRSSLRKCAIGLFVVTMVKVFLVDMAKVSTPYRVISFMVLGLMLIGASYLYYRFKKQLLPTTASKEESKR